MIKQVKQTRPGGGGGGGLDEKEKPVKTVYTVRGVHDMAKAEERGCSDFKAWGGGGDEK